MRNLTLFISRSVSCNFGFANQDLISSKLNTALSFTSHEPSCLPAWIVSFSRIQWYHFLIQQCLLSHSLKVRSFLSTPRGRLSEDMCSKGIAWLCGMLSSSFKPHSAEVWHDYVSSTVSSLIVSICNFFKLQLFHVFK